MYHEYIEPRLKQKKGMTESVNFTILLQRDIEGNYRKMRLDQLIIKKGETFLEIGFGTGHCLNQIAKLAGKTGKGYGVDISSGMLKVAKKRLVSLFY